MSRTVALADAGATEALGAALAAALAGLGGPRVLALSGELGAGKTTLTRGLLRALGATGTVRSPTYTLVESYELGAWQVHHLDLYRLRDAGEAEGLGLRDLLTPTALLVIEWPERDAPLAARADLRVRLVYEGDARRAELEPRSPAGREWLDAVRAARPPATSFS